MTNDFKTARDVLTADEKAIAELDRAINRKCDWDDPQDVAYYRSALRLEERHDLLDRFVPERICPRCRRGPLISSRQWVVSLSKRHAVCRSCWGKVRHVNLPDHPEKFNVQIFEKPEPRFILSAFRLEQSREKAGLSRRAFAQLCGWHFSYQQKLESGVVKTVNQDTRDTIVEVLSSNGLNTVDME